MASDLVSNLDSITTTLDAASGVVAYFQEDLTPNTMPTTAYVAVQIIPGGTFDGGFDDADLSFADLVLQLTSWSPVSFADAATKAQAALGALTSWSLDSGAALVREAGWRGVRFDVRFTASYDAIS